MAGAAIPPLISPYAPPNQAYSKASPSSHTTLQARCTKATLTPALKAEQDWTEALEKFSNLPKDTLESQGAAFDAALKVLIILTRRNSNNRRVKGNSTRDILLNGAPFLDVRNLNKIFLEKKGISWDELLAAARKNEVLDYFAAMLLKFSSLPYRSHEQYSRMIIACGELYQIKVAEDLLGMASREEGSQRGMTSAYTALIGCHARMCDYGGALNVYEEMKSKEIPTNIGVHTELLQAFVKTVDLEIANRTRIETEKAYLRNKQSFSEHVKRDQLGMVDATAAIDIYRNVIKEGLAPNNHFFTLMLLLATRIKNFEFGERILAEMAVYNIPVDGHICGLVTHLYASNGLVTKAEEFLARYTLENNVKANIHCLNSLLSAYTRSGDVKNAIRIFDRIKKDAEPFFITFSMLFGMFLDLDRLPDALEVLDQMKSAGFEPNPQNYNHLLSYYQRKSMYSHFFTLLEHMKEIGIDGGHYARSMAIGLLGQQGKVDDLRQVWEELKKKDNVSLMEYSNLVRHLLSLEDDTTLQDVVKQLTKASVFKADSLYSTRTFLYAFTRVSNYDAAYQCLEQLYEEGSTRPDTHMYNVVLQGLAIDGRFNEMDRFWELMKRMKCFPTHTSFVLLIYLAGEMGEIEKVDSLWQAYRDSGLVLLSEPVKSVMSAYIKNGKPERALQIFSIVKSNHRRLLSESLYSFNVEALINLDRIDEAWAILDEMNSMLLSPSVRTFNVFLNYYSRQADIENFSRVLERMKAERVQPNQYSYALTVRLKVSLNQFDEAEQLVSDLEQNDPEVADSAKIHLIGGVLRLSCSQDQYYHKAKQLSCGIKPTANLYVAWIHYYGRVGDLGRARDTLETMRSHGFTPDQRLLSYISHLETCEN